MSSSHIPRLPFTHAILVSHDLCTLPFFFLERILYTCTAEPIQCPNVHVHCIASVTGLPRYTMYTCTLYSGSRPSPQYNVLVHVHCTVHCKLFTGSYGSVLLQPICVISICVLCEIMPGSFDHTVPGLLTVQCTVYCRPEGCMHGLHVGSCHIFI